MPTGKVEIENKKKEVSFKGYVTAPANGVYPGVLLLHQGYGLDANIRAFAESLAANNYTVFIPDLFWRDMPGCELNSASSDDNEKSLSLINSFNIDNSFEDITLCLKWLRETPQCNGLVTVIGFGVGANLAYLAGLWLDIESSVCYDFEGCNFFQENDMSIRRPMLIQLSKKIFDSLVFQNKKNLSQELRILSYKLIQNVLQIFTELQIRIIMI